MSVSFRFTSLPNTVFGLLKFWDKTGPGNLSLERTGSASRLKDNGSEGRCRSWSTEALRRTTGPSNTSLDARVGNQWDEARALTDRGRTPAGTRSISETSRGSHELVATTSTRTRLGSWKSRRNHELVKTGTKQAQRLAFWTAEQAREGRRSIRSTLAGTQEWHDFCYLATADWQLEDCCWQRQAQDRMHNAKTGNRETSKGVGQAVNCIQWRSEVVWQSAKPLKESS